MTMFALTGFVAHDTVLGRTLRLPLKLIPNNIVLPILQGPLKGKRWIVGSCVHGCWLGSYERDMQTSLTEVIKPGFVVYDLGANAGFYSLLSSVLVGATGQVYSFEPVPRNIRYFRQHMKMNNVDNVQLFEAAVSRKAGTGYFDFDKDHVSGHLGNQGLPVRIVGLDELYAAGQLRGPDLVKMDIEGAEFDALRGMEMVLRRHMPPIFLSTHGPAVHRQCHEFLANLDYRVTSIEELPGVDYSNQTLRQIMAVPK